jgi:aminopeptidase
MKKTILRKYAKLIARVGVKIRKGQDVVIQAELDQPEFVEMLTDECYKAGARKVTVEWSHQPLQKYHVRHRSLKTLSALDDWEVAKLEHYADTLPCRIYLISEDPDGLCGINQEKNAKALQARYKVIKPIRDKMENKYQWCIAAVPGVKWAKKVFPGERASRAVELLWEAILKTSRVDEDPEEAWRKHNEDLARRCEYLNSLGIESLEYKSSNGTDLKVGMIPDALFCGGGEYALGSGNYFNPNIPSEEVFTTPKRGEAEGIVYSTKPLSYRGELIEDFSIRFEGGRAVEVKAKRGEELLKQMISMDEGAAYLGECALVPYDSPIRNSGILFYNTLFDENAACHLALGMGFSNCLKDYEKYTLDECRAKGINDSQIHEDFMIGSADLAIDAVCEDGKTVAIFRDGTWAF